ncbi:hypothetical protein HELRODRAFT_156842 [Helobdella robusta]|uniref:ABC transporter domain-containing protein n=1 Tax=Helobdella robusta TaxID=6412 RepID=T1EM17_HELRO|nr:hypothetical protein HELRODRAFT_156842 [Helobdella robusta]ESO05673.1 hypothetical protein HELRODRAFT_156842 [Helobdella robusta]
MSFIYQLKTLLWKNFRLRSKKRIQLCAEIIWPLFLFIVLILIKASFRNSLINETQDCFFEERSLPSAGIFSFFRSFYCSMNTSTPCFKYVKNGLQVYTKNDSDWNAEDELRRLEKNIIERFSNVSDETSNNCSFFSNRLKLLQPLFNGKILYTPDNDDINKIISEAKSFFTNLFEIKFFLENFERYFFIMIDSFKNNVIYEELKIVTPLFSYLSSSNLLTSLVKFLEEDFHTSNITDLLKISMKLLNCFSYDRFVAVPDEYSLTKLALQLIDNKTFLAGLVFDIIQQNNSNIPLVKYKIRLDQDFIDLAYKLNLEGETKLSNLQFNPRILPSFLKSGFVYLQDIIEHALIRIYLGEDNVGTVLQQFPSPCYTENIFINIFIRLLPLFMVVSWLVLVPIIVKDIVKEKELKLSEFIKIMGLGSGIQWLAWFLHFFLLVLIPIFLLCFLLKFGDLLPNASFSLLFVLMMFFMIALITQCFMYSVFFSRSNTAAAFSAICYFVLFLPYRLCQSFQDSMPFASKLIACFSFTSAFGFACSYSAKYEALGEGIQWSNIFRSPEVNDKFNFGFCLLMIMVDIILHTVVTLYVDAVFPGNYGIAKPWYFPVEWIFMFRKNKNNSSSIRNAIDMDELTQISNELKVNNLDVGVSIVNLVKKFKKFVAVNNLNAEFYKNHVTGFLGHNGAGKTTTLSIITGLYGPSSGTVYVNNMDVKTQIKEIRKIISLCPQHNILYDDLTVMEHLLFYSMLKGLPKKEIKSECNRILMDLNLFDKRDVNSSFLSGGMKRKLSVGVAYIGSPDVVVLDEPTAGVDAYARRSIWDLIQKYKNNRTTILSTHLMDEADILSDRLIIINKGQVLASGSIMFLKKHFGKGYHLDISFDKYFKNEKEREKQMDVFIEFIKKFVPNAEPDVSTHNFYNFVFILPYSEVDKFNNLFKNLDLSKSSLQFVNYGLSDTTLEQVFLQVNKNSEPLPEEADLSSKFSRFKFCPEIKPHSGFIFLFLQFWSLIVKRYYFSKRSFKTIFCQLILPPLFVALTMFITNFRFKFSTDEPSVEIHPWLIKSKQLHLTSFLSRNENLNWDSRDMELSLLNNPGMGNRCLDPKIHKINNLDCYRKKYKNLTFLISPENPEFNISCSCKAGYKKCSDSFSGEPPPQLKINNDDVFQNLTHFNIQQYLVDTQHKFSKTRFAGIEFYSTNPFNYSVSINILNNLLNILNLTDKILEGLQITNSSNVSVSLKSNLKGFCPHLVTDDVVIVWYSHDSPTAIVAYSNVVHNAILRSKYDNVSSKKIGIVVYSHPLNATFEQRLESRKILEILPPVVILFALTIIPTSFLFFLIEEKNSGSMHLQYISGLNSTLYWISNFVWDTLMFLSICLIFILIFIIFNAKEFVSKQNMLTFTILTLTYGWAVIPLTYFFIWIFTDSNTGYIFLSGVYFLFGLVPTIVTFVIDFIPTDEDWSDFFQTLFIFIPQFCLSRGLIEMSSNYINYNAKVMLFGEDSVKYTNPIAFHAVGKFICSLFIFGCLSLTSFLVAEFLSHKNSSCKNDKFRLGARLVTNSTDEDVLNEEKRIFSEPLSNNVLAVTNLIKYYQHRSLFRKNSNSILAVNNVTFGVLQRECFGLLGINGAGKSTLFKMLTGDIHPSAGNIFLRGSNFSKNTQKAQNLFGYCPQFDAICNLMTVKEHLVHFSKLRGAPSENVKLICEWAYLNLDLLAYKDTLAMHLSGGNKRKLSIALALIGNPDVVYLDEPTAGIDPKARKYVWESIVGTVRAGHSVVLTSHSLEECEFLCNRLTIMVSGELKCIGTIQHLKNKFNEGYTIDVKLKEIVNVDENFKRITDFILKSFPETKLLERHLNFAKFRLPASFNDLSFIFKVLSQAKSMSLIDDFSINQTKLEQIFMNFARQANSSI